MDAIFLFIALIAIGPIVRIKKDELIYSIILFLITGITLHGIVGFGLNYGFIYSPLYVPLLIILFARSTMGYTVKWLQNSIVGFLIIMVCLNSLNWILSLGRNINKVSFPITEWKNPSSELQIDRVKFQYSYPEHILSSKGEILLRKVDSIQASEKYKQIVGTLDDGTIFIVIVNGDQYKIQFNY